MLAGLYFFYLNLKSNGFIKPTVTWTKFKLSNCWYNITLQTKKQRDKNEKTIFKRKN